MPNRKRENLKVGFTKSDPPKGVNAVDSIVVDGRSKGWGTYVRGGSLPLNREQSIECT
jgi:hypothetical protein